jgi:hypothetical protein
MAINPNTNYGLDSSNPTYVGERNFLLKVAENNPLRLNSTSANLSVHIDSMQRLVIGYGYDLFVNRANAPADLAGAGIALTPAQAAAILRFQRCAFYGLDVRQR